LAIRKGAAYNTVLGVSRVRGRHWIHEYNICQRGTLVFLNLDLISGMKYVYLLTVNSLAKVGVLRELFRKLAICIYPYNGVNWAGTMQPLNKALSVFISPIL